jgi:hypothetical protein
MALSAAVGTVPQLHLAGSFQSPEPPSHVQVAAQEKEADIMAKTGISRINLQKVFNFFIVNALIFNYLHSRHVSLGS